MYRISRIIQFIAIISLGLAYLGCGKGRNNNKTNNDDPMVAVPVEVTQVEIGSVSAFYSGTSTLEAESEAIVVAKVAGVVEEILVEEGNRVKARDILAQLDGEKLTVQFAQFEANLQRHESDFRRNKELFNKNLISTQEYQSSKFTYEAQRAAYDLAKLDLGYTTIRSPIDGVVAQRMIKIGNMVTVNQEIFKITDFDPLLAVVYIPEHEMSKLRLNQSVTLTVDAVQDLQFSGHIERISPVIDPMTGTIKVTIIVEDPSEHLKAGMFVRAQIIYDTHNKTLLIPKDAVLIEGNESAVFVVRDSTAYRELIQTGYTNKTHIEVLAGLQFGDTIVTTGQGSLKDSAKVDIVIQ